MRLIIAGSRKITDFDYLREVFESYPELKDVSEIVSGGARGVDLLGERLAEELGIPVKRFPADWDNIHVPNAVVKRHSSGKEYNARAGIMRNMTMADYADALLALWDGKSTGTRHMINTMQKLEKPAFVKKY